MTRINLVDVTILADQHLIAEYREITRVFSLVEKSLVKNTIEQICKLVPPTFRLNKGHVTFFYDKLLWIEKRYTSLYDETLRRGFNVSNPYELILKYRKSLPQSLYNDFVPSEDDISISMDRLILRLSERPEFYRYMGEKVYLGYRQVPGNVEL